MGPPKRSEKARFKDDLILVRQRYGLTNQRSLYLSMILPLCELLKSQDTAAHLFPYKLGPDILVSLFGGDVFQLLGIGLVFTSELLFVWRKGVVAF